MALPSGDFGNTVFCRAYNQSLKSSKMGFDCCCLVLSTVVVDALSSLSFFSIAYSLANQAIADLATPGLLLVDFTISMKYLLACAIQAT